MRQPCKRNWGVFFLTFIYQIYDYINFFPIEFLLTIIKKALCLGSSMEPSMESPRDPKVDPKVDHDQVPWRFGFIFNLETTLSLRSLPTG